ncbi:hypothetical protein ACJBSJ_10800, partial [Streptococcus suis]
TRKAQTVREKVAEGYRLDLLLTIDQIVPSTYHYKLKQLDKPHKDKHLKAENQPKYQEQKANKPYPRKHQQQTKPPLTHNNNKQKPHK